MFWLKNKDTFFNYPFSCADLESFSEGSNLDYVFLVDEGREDRNTTLSGPMVAQH